MLFHSIIGNGEHMGQNWGILQVTEGIKSEAMKVPEWAATKTVLRKLPEILKRRSYKIKTGKIQDLEERIQETATSWIDWLLI